MGQTTGGQHYSRDRKTAQDDHDWRGRDRLVDNTIREDHVLFGHNRIEMIPFAPFVETLVDQKTTRSFPRHASLVYTPTPSREAWSFKKAVDRSSKGKSQGQHVPSKRVELRESFLWDNTENMLHDDHIYAEEIPLLPYPSNQRANRAAAPTSENIQLRRQVHQLEQKLSDKACQLQAAEENAQQIHLQSNATIERLQSQIHQKDQALQTVQNQLLERELEVVSLQSHVKKSEVNVQASNMKADSLEEELDGLRCQVGALLFLVQSQMSSFVEDVVKTPPVGEESRSASDETVIEEPTSRTASDIVSMVGRQVDEIHALKVDGLDEEHIEKIRKKYVEALIDARENPSDEMLSLVAELRMQLHALLMCPMLTTSTIKDEMCQQPLGIPTY